MNKSVYLLSAVLLATPVIAYVETQALDMPETAFVGSARLDIQFHLLAMFAALVLGVIVWMMQGVYRPGFKRRRVVALRVFVAIFLSYGLATYVAESTWAVESKFEANREAIENLRKSIADGGQPKRPVVAGAYSFSDYELLPNDVIVLYTKTQVWGGDADVADPRRACWGFVYCPADVKDEGLASMVGLKGSTGEHNIVRRLEGHWFVIFDYYIYLKRGWS